MKQDRPKPLGARKKKAPVSASTADIGASEFGVVSGNGYSAHQVLMTRKTLGLSSLSRSILFRQEDRRCRPLAKIRSPIEATAAIMAAVSNRKRIVDRLMPFEGEAGVTALFAQVIERLEQEVSLETVRRALCLIACSLAGLSEQELANILSGPESDLAPARDHFDEMHVMIRQIRPYLLRRGPYVEVLTKKPRRDI